MKETFFSAILTTIVVLAANAQIVNIPDANFKNALLNHTPVIDTDNDGEISISEAAALGTMSVHNKNISNLTGIEHFVNITVLGCTENNLTSLDLSNNMLLQNLNCDNNQLTALDFSNNLNLYYVTASVNQLTTLNLGNNTTLAYLICSANQLSILDVSQNSALQILYCALNQLTSLDVSQNPNLKELGCNNNGLTSLNVANGNNTNTQKIFAADNPDLICVQVDDPIYSSANWTGTSFQFDPQISFINEGAVCPVTSINEAAQNIIIAVYPNPTKNQISFSVQANAQLTNLTGQIVDNKKSINTLDLSDQPTGIYYITFTDDKGQVLQRTKIVKE